MLTAGSILAELVEVVAVHLLGRWEYSMRMPTIFGIGVVPIAQMLLLPPLIFRTACVFNAQKVRKYHSTHDHDERKTDD